MTSCATYDDVNLVLRLYDLRREERMREARRAWSVANFHAKSLEKLNETCPPGANENASFRMVVTYWDMAASFITGGVLQQETDLPERKGVACGLGTVAGPAARLSREPIRSHGVRGLKSNCIISKRRRLS